MKQYNVLVFPCGTEVANEIFRSLKNHKYFKLQGATSIENSYCDFRDIEINKLPFITNNQFLSHLQKLIKKNNIDFIIPAHDDVSYKLSMIESELSVKIIGQSKKVNQIVRFKDKTYQYFEKIVPIPKYQEDPKNESNYPLFVKPKKGQGAHNSFKLKDKNEYSAFVKNYNKDDFVIMEYLSGGEFTIDCFSDSGVLKYAGGRSRDKTINGISVKSSFINNDKLNKKFNKYAKIISKELNMDGVWFYQMKYDKNNNLKLLEIAPRVSGTMMVNRARGINFIELALYQKLGYDLELLINNIEVTVGRSLEPVYKHNVKFDNLYVDFDDTLLLNEKYINSDLMKLIFQVKNENKNVILITKHNKNLMTYILHKYGIINIFDNIIHLDSNDKKSNYIEKNSLLIDDSFQERKDIISSGSYAIGLENIEIFLS